MKKIKKLGKKIKTKTKKIKTEVKQEFSFNVPNSISLLRLILTFLLVYMIFAGFGKWSIGIVFTIAALSDWFDGFFARRLKQTTVIGARMDQVMDRIFTVVLILALLIYFYFSGYAEKILLLFLVSSREIIALPGFIIRLVLDKQTYQVKYIGKVTTFIQSVAVGFLLVNLPGQILMVLIASFFGILSGFDYLKDSLQ